MAYIPGGPINAAETVRMTPDSKPLPVGIYSGIITKIEHKPTRSDGVMVVVEFDITSPPDFANRKFWDNFNVVNANSDTVRIAREGLGDLGQACGVAELQDDEQLMGREVLMELYIEQGKPYLDKMTKEEKMGRDQNRCGKYWPIGTDIETARKAHKEKQKAKQPAVSATTARSATQGAAATGNTSRWLTKGAATTVAPVQATAQQAAAQQSVPAQAAVASAATNTAPWKRNKQ